MREMIPRLPPLISEDMDIADVEKDAVVFVGQRTIIQDGELVERNVDAVTGASEGDQQ
jgi:hypothetical protein